MFFLFSYFSSFSQNNENLIPNHIPKNVREYVQQKYYEMISFTDDTKMIVRYEMSLDSVFYIEFYPNNLIVNYDAVNSKVLSFETTNITKKSCLETKNIALGWFRQYPDFEGDYEQPHHDICIAKSGYYSELNLKDVSWGYSSHHFELSTWSSCYGKYIHTTQAVSLGALVYCGNHNCIRWCDFTNEELNYEGYYFKNTNLLVDNNAIYYQIDFYVEYEPTKIVGNGIVCTNQQTTFTLINNCFKAHSIVWSKSNNLSYIDGQGSENYVVKTKNINGKAWVKATYLTTCGEKSKQFDFWIGKPNFSIYGTEELIPRQPGMAIINYSNNSISQGISNVNWSYTGPLSYISGGISKARYKAGNRFGIGFIYAVATNTCGQNENRMFYEVSNWHKIYPNPVNDFLTIEVDRNKIPEHLKFKKIEILLYDNMKVLQQHKFIDKNLIILDIGYLKSNVYILHIIIGNETFEEKIIISH